VEGPRIPGRSGKDPDRRQSDHREEAQRIADSIVNTFPAILARIKALLGGPTK
jgi:hypothetical protein